MIAHLHDFHFSFLIALTLDLDLADDTGGILFFD